MVREKGKGVIVRLRFGGGAIPDNGRVRGKGIKIDDSGGGVAGLHLAANQTIRNHASVRLSSRNGVQSGLSERTWRTGKAKRGERKCE